MMQKVTKKTGRDIIHRYEGNPIITIDDLPFQCSDIWNAGVVRFNGEYLLLLTVESLEGLSNIYLAHGSDGCHFLVEPEPFMSACEDDSFARYESFGILDPRITRIDETYYIAFFADSESGKQIGLARTNDFQSVERMPLISEPDTKSGAMFPRKIDGRYAMLERPSDGGSIWITYSSDLIYWGCSTVVVTPRSGYWDSTRVGAAAPPIEIDEGWLLIYYGVKDTTAGPLMRLGAAVLDRNDPSRVIARSNIPILAPREKYERIGDVGNVVFSCGALLEEDGQVKVYYGASDSCICLGTASLDSILQVCKESKEEY